MRLKSLRSKFILQVSLLVLVVSSVFLTFFIFEFKRTIQEELNNQGSLLVKYLAYAQEIAQAMLRRQQAQAIIAARKKIVEGAVGMVQDALRMLSEQKIVELDEEKKAQMVNNLMVALVSESEAQPIINTGSLY